MIAHYPKSKRERLVAAINSGNDDLFDTGTTLVITGKNAVGKRIYLGEISTVMIYQNSREFVWGLIDRIRFAPHNRCNKQEPQP
jgi:hypothetical protein